MPSTVDDRADELREWYAEDEPDGAEMLNSVEDYLARFVVYPSPHERVAHALWIVHTHLMDFWESTPRIAFLSPEPGSGKSRALEVTEPLVPRPVHAVNTTPAYLFRKVSDAAGPPTILYDEIDTVFGPKAKDNEDIRGMLNAGHRKGATAGRCVVRGKIVETEELPAYCAVALAGLDDLPETIMTRSIVVRMRRRAPGEKVEPWRLRINGPDAARLKDRIAAWAASVADTLAGGDFWPAMPEGIEDRDADVWESLLTVADLAGGRWPADARKAAVTAVTAKRQTRLSIGLQLLADIRTVFDGITTDATTTEHLLIVLGDIEESPWRSIRKGEPLDARSLALRLGKYGIGSKPQRAGETVFKGYSRAQFEDAWNRYLPPAAPRDDCAVTSVTESDDPAAPRDDSAVTAVTESPGDAAIPAPPAKSGTARPAAAAPVCTHCGKPVTASSQVDTNGQPAHLSCIPDGRTPQLDVVDQPECQYCRSALRPSMHSQIARGYCNKAPCMTAAKEVNITSAGRAANR